jgi:hypothetical protein
MAVLALLAATTTAILMVYGCSGEGMGGSLSLAPISGSCQMLVMASPRWLPDPSAP